MLPKSSSSKPWEWWAAPLGIRRHKVEKWRYKIACISVKYSRNHVISDFYCIWVNLSMSWVPFVHWNWIIIHLYKPCILCRLLAALFNVLIHAVYGHEGAHARTLLELLVAHLVVIVMPLLSVSPKKWRKGIEFQLSWGSSSFKSTKEFNWKEILLIKSTHNLRKKNNVCNLKNIKNTFTKDVFLKEL